MSTDPSKKLFWICRAPSSCSLGSADIFKRALPLWQDQHQIYRKERESVCQMQMEDTLSQHWMTVSKKQIVPNHLTAYPGQKLAGLWGYTAISHFSVGTYIMIIFNQNCLISSEEQMDTLITIYFRVTNTSNLAKVARIRMI